MVVMVVRVLWRKVTTGEELTRAEIGIWSSVGRGDGLREKGSNEKPWKGKKAG